MSVDLRVQSRVPSLTQSWNRVGHPRTSLLLETPPRFKRSTTNIRFSVTMCMKIVVESDNRHLEQIAKSLCAQDTTLSRKYILSVSARPRRQMTAGTVISWHHQVRLKATCRNPFKPLFWTVCWIVVHTGHHIHQAHATSSLLCDACMWTCWTYWGTFKSVYYMEKNKLSSVVLWSYKNFGICNSCLCWPVSEHWLAL